MQEKKNLEIEALRGLSIFLVFIQHADAIVPWIHWPLWEALTKIGNFGVGVDLFFCISGFVVSRSIVDAIDRARPQGAAAIWAAVKAFWIRRCFRLLPSVYFWVSVTVLATAFFNHGEAFGALDTALRQAAAVFFYIQNILICHYVNNGTPIMALGPLWSLSLEEQFYFIFPIFLIFTTGRLRIAALVGIVAVQATWPRAAPSEIGLWFRTDAIALGVLVFFFSRSAAYRKLDPAFLADRSLSLAVNVICIFTLLTLSRALYKELSFISFWTSDAAVSAALVLIASYSKGYGLSSGWLSPVLLWLGSRSFAIYIIHMPIFRFNFELWWRLGEFYGRPLSSFDPFLIFLSGIVLTLGFAELNYRWLEEPLRKLGRTISDRAALATTGYLASNAA